MPGALESKHTSAGLTLALTLALAVGLSLAPLPEAWRPIPSLAQGPVGPQLIALVTTSSAAAKRKAIGVEPDTALAPEVPVLPEEEEARSPRSWSRPTPPTPAPPPPQPTVTAATDTLGLADLGPATLAKAMRMEALREKMGSKHVDLDPGCRRMGASGCEEHGLEPFFKALRGAAQRRPHRPRARGAPG